MPLTKVNWGKSKAKAMLREGIASGQIIKKTDKEMLHSSHPEYKKLNPTQFKRNLMWLLTMGRRERLGGTKARQS
jgi:hypothetical protein